MTPTRLLFLSILGALNLHAADFFISPAGSGTKDGTSLENSAPGSEISAFFNENLKHGDRLLLTKGNYKDVNLHLESGGEKGRPKTIEAEKDAVISSTWTIEKPDKGATAVLLAPGLSYVTVKNLSIRNYCFGVLAKPSKETPRVGLTFEGVSIQQMRHGFYMSDCDFMLLKDCSLIRYSKHGYRLEQGCDDVSFINCLANCSEGDTEWETKTEVFTFGFNINNGGAPNTKLLFEDCISMNNIKSNQKVKYTNGDGFSMESNTSDVTLLRCFALRNQDAGFDLKVPGVTLTDCVSTHCRRAFRLWAKGTITNCFGGWTQTGVWAKAGPIDVSKSTFYALTRNASGADTNKNLPITLDNCLITRAEESPDFTLSTGNSVLKDCVSEGSTFTTPVDPWDGTGNNFDSTSHPEKGYSSKRITAK